MGRTIAWFLLLLTLLDTTLKPTYASSCKVGCSGQTKNVLKLQEGTTYVYNLEATTKTSIPKSSCAHGESTNLNLRAKVEVNVQAQCSALIRLKSVEVVGPDDKKYSSLSKIEANPLRVSLNGGALSRDACAVGEDDYTSLNIKRAVASLLQLNAAETSTVPQEVDVFGVCPTDYVVQKEGDETVYHKKRDLKRCSYRENIQQSIFSVPNAGDSILQSTPLLEPFFHAEIHVKGGIVQSAKVYENYLFRPFSDKDNGANTRVDTKITLESTTAGTIEDTTYEPRSIIFESPHEGVSVTIQTVIAALHKSVDGIDNAANVNAAKNFADLVSVIRRASADDLLSVYGQVKAGAGFKNKEAAKNIYRQALNQAGSADSVAMIIELLKSREMPSLSNSYEAFAFARHVSVTTLDKAASILDEIKLPPAGYLGIGSLVGIYCRQHSCNNVAIVNIILSRLAAPLAKTIPANRGEETRSIFALKAIRNAKVFNVDVTDKIAAIIKDTKSTNRLRSVALDTALTNSCKKQIQKATADVLNNREEDSELRIKAYLVLVECPNAKTANKLSEFIETEPSNQVGAFITSHLRNLRATANPDRQVARELLQNVKPRANFPSDVRKFSFNLEGSYDIDALGASASAEGNVIYSQKSYLPRYTNLNLTAEVFGHNLNLFEVYARGENVERIIEKYFGPKGEIRQKKGTEIYIETIRKLFALKKYGNDKISKLRNKRSPALDEIKAFGGQIQKDTTQLDNEPVIDIGLRLFSNEIFSTFLDDEMPITGKSVIDFVVDMIEKNIGVGREFNQKVQTNNLFLDAELTYPTASGLPVKLSATGTSVIDLQLSSQTDIAAILKDPENGKAKIGIRPSASIEIIGKLTVNADIIEAGVKLATTLHTATGTDITLQVLDGQGIDIQVGLPLKESDILTVSTELLTTVRPKDEVETTELLKLQVPRKDFQGCFDQLLPIVGLTLCGKVGFPNDPNTITSGAALYPLNGHSKLSLKLDKEDESLKYYHFRFQFNLKDRKHRRIEALIDTPGSNIPRELGLLVEAKTDPNKEINIKLRSPLYSLLAQALIVDTDSEYTLSGILKLDEIFSYKGRLGLLINGATYTPILEVTNADGSIAKLVDVEGTVTVEKNSPQFRKYTFNNVRVSNSQGKISVDGTIVKDSNLFETDLKIGYDQGTVGVKTKLQHQTVNNIGGQVKIAAEVTPSQYPDFGFSVKYEYNRGEKSVEENLVITHGRDLTSKDSRLSIFQHITVNAESAQRFDISTKNTLQYPLFGIEGKLEGHVTQKSINYDLLLAYDQNKVTSKLTAKTGISKLGDYQIDFSASALNNGLSIELKRDIVGPNKSKFQNTLVLTPGGKYSVDAEVTHQVEKSNVDARVLLVVKLEDVPEPYKLDFGVIANPATLEAHSKITAGGNDLLDVEVKQKRSTPQSGSFKFILRNALDSRGEYKRAGEKATATFVINILPISRKIKGVADLKIAGTKHAGSIEVLYDADKDPSRKIVIQTDNDITSKSIRSELEASGHSALINFRGEATGKLGNGGINGGYEIILSTGHHIVGHANHVLHILPSNSNGELSFELGYAPSKSTPLSEFAFELSAKNVDLKRYTLDAKTSASFASENGKVAYTQTIRSAHQDGKVVIDLQNALGGTRLGEHQYSGTAKLIANRNNVNYQASAKLGQKYSVSAEGKIQPGLEDKTISLEQTLTAKTPAESLSNIKLVSALRIVPPGSEHEPCELKASQELAINDKSYKLTVEGLGSEHDASYKGTVVVPNQEPYTGQVTYKHIDGDDLEKCEGTLELVQGDKAIKLNLKLDSNNDMSLINAKLTGSTPLDAAKNIDITVGIKGPTPESGSMDVKAIVNDNTLELKLKTAITINQLLLDYGGTYNGQKFRYYLKIEPKGQRSFHTESQVAYLQNGGGQVDSSVTADLENLENFNVNVKVHSEKLDINKFRLEFGNKPTKGGQAKRVNFNAQNAGGKIFGGSATYAIKENEWGFSIEGKGQMNVKGENNPLTYKIEYARKKGDEKGLFASATGNFGKGSYHGEITDSNKQTSLIQKYTYENKYTDTNYYVSIRADGTKELVLKSKSNFFGPPFDHEFALITTSKQDGLFSNTEGSLTVRGTKYSFRNYVQKNEAGAILDVPTREIAAIVQYQLPLNMESNRIEAKIDASLYLDKKKNPNDKTHVLLLASIDEKEKSLSSKILAKLSNPSIRELSVKHEGILSESNVKGTFDIDVFAKKAQKMALSYVVGIIPVPSGRNLTAQAQLISKGLSMDFGGSGHVFAGKMAFSAGSFIYFCNDKNVKQEVGAYIAASPKEASALVKVPGHTLVDGDFKMSLNGHDKTIEGQLTLAEGDTGVLKVLIAGLEKIEVTINPKSNANRKLVGLAVLNKEKAEIRAERVDGGNKETLFYAVTTVNKDDLIKFDYDFQAENMKKTAKYFENLGQDVLNRARTINKNLAKELQTELKNLAEAAKKAEPNFTPLFEKYESTLKAIHQEIENDKNFKELAGGVKRAVTAVFEITTIIIHNFVKYFDMLNRELLELQSRLNDAYAKIAPELNEVYNELVEIYTDILKNALKVGNEFVQQLLDVIKAHEKDIKLVIGKVAESFQDIGKVVIRNVRQFTQEIQDFAQLLLDQLKSLPIVDQAKDRVKELINLELPAEFFELFEELQVSVTDIMPTPELKALVERIFKYVEKRLKRESVNDAEELAAITREATDVARKVYQELKDHYGLQTEKLPIFGYSLPMPYLATAVLELPELGNIKFSPLTLLLSTAGDLPNPLDLLFTYRPTTNPLPPFKAYGIILNSHHLFTFDKKHYSFKGSCSYVLAQDVLDGNFSIIANLDNGKIKSLTIADQTDVVDLLPDNTVVVNGKAGDYPVSSNDISGWRRYDSVNVAIRNSVFITKYISKDLYVIRVSGFYFARTRGLLGTINYEQYDEFTLPNGHIAKTSAEFVNSYKLSSCPAIPESSHTAPHAPECTSFFTSDSSLRIFFNILPPTQFREACDQHVAMMPAAALKAACEVASAYVTALNQEDTVLASIPPECAKCAVNGKTLELGQSEEIKSPAGKADVVLVVEQSTHNSAVFKDLVTPLISALSADLKEKGLSDVEFSLIGYGGPGQKWPAHYGSKGKITYEGNSEAIKFGDRDTEDFVYYDILMRIAFNIKKIIDAELGNDPLVIAMNEANKYPFRQGASKTIILVNSSPCKRSPLWPVSLQVPRTLAVYQHYNQHGLNFYLISPLSGLSINSPDGKDKAIVGFDSGKIYKLSDAKKKPLEGDATDRDRLNYDFDICVAFSQYYGGAAFSSQNLIDAKPEQKKKFVHVVSQRIAQGAAAKSFNEDCRCTLKDGFIPATVCTKS